MCSTWSRTHASYTCHFICLHYFHCSFRLYVIRCWPMRRVDARSNTNINNIVRNKMKTHETRLDWLLLCAMCIEHASAIFWHGNHIRPGIGLIFVILFFFFFACNKRNLLLRYLFELSLLCVEQSFAVYVELFFFSICRIFLVFHWTLRAHRIKESPTSNKKKFVSSNSNQMKNVCLHFKRWSRRYGLAQYYSSFRHS